MNLTTKSSAPTKKVALGGFGGAVTVVALWILTGLTGVEPPASVGAAIALIVTVLISYLVPASSDEFIETEGLPIDLELLANLDPEDRRVLETLRALKGGI